jgi:hypothetical protein
MPLLLHFPNLTRIFLYLCCAFSLFNQYSRSLGGYRQLDREEQLLLAD